MGADTTYPFLDARDDNVPISWNPRGVGLDECPCCFICGATKRNDEPGTNWYMNNIAAILSKRNESAAMVCFQRGARMAYHHGDPNVPQIKIGVCDRHVPAAEELCNQWFISPRSVDRFVNRILRMEEWEAEKYERLKEQV